MVAVEVVLSRVQVPTSYLIAIHAVEIIVPNVAAPVVLGQERPVWLLPCFILHICRYGVLREGRQRPVPDVGTRIREGHVVEAPERPKFAKRGKSAVDEVLVGTVETIVNDPMKVTLNSGELDVDVVAALVGDRRREPFQIRRSAV